MSVIRIEDPQATRPSHVVMIVLVAFVVAGGSLLLSVPESKSLVDGAIEWHEESPLRAVVQLLCLNYSYPTLNAGDVKMLILGVGAGLAALVLGIAAISGTRRGDEEVETDDTVAASSEPPVVVIPSKRRHVAPLVAAEVLIGLYLLWSFASSRWSPAPELAVGGSILLTVQFLWSFAIGNGMSAAAARKASRAIVIVAGITSLVAIWYFYGRNPVIRAKFPFGNPTFLSACLIPGILLSITLFFEQSGKAYGTRSAKPILLACGALATLGVSLWAFDLTGSRGPLLGLAVGILAAAFFALRGWKKVLPVLLAVAVVAGAWMMLGRQGESDPSGRSMTIRFREYAWSYAMRMFTKEPFTGFGQGGFVLVGDSFVVEDVLDDPLVFTSRIAHAHNEWLEVLADLGSLGLVFVAGAFLLTLRAGMHRLRANPPTPERWVLIGLMGAFVGLIIEECSGVGLRVSGIPALLFTVLGLIWAVAGRGSTRPTSSSPSARRRRRMSLGVVASVMGVGAVVVSLQDFAAARNTYRIEEHLADGNYEEAVAVAEMGTSRLNPQRALTNLYRLGEAHMLAAKMLQDRAIKRETLARQHETTDHRLLRLAAGDYRGSDAHCMEGSKVLRQLVRWSPAYFNHGYLEYWLNRISARNPKPGGESENVELFIANAAAAIERELRRQPFNLPITMEHVRMEIGKLSTDQLVDTLARPLRHSRLGGAYYEMLLTLASNPEFIIELDAIADRARKHLLSGEDADDLGQHRWAPEVLRVAAAVYRSKGRYQAAEDSLTAAVAAYEKLSSSAPLGAASCSAELADCQFARQPGLSAPALKNAARAIEIAPQSEMGRLLAANVRRRMITYHLAGGEEDKAESLLRELAPPGTPDDLVRMELGSRYARMCRELLQRPTADAIRVPVRELPADYAKWVDRAIELAPNNYQAHYLAADLASSSHDCQATAKHINQAIQAGLPLDTAWEFVGIVRGTGIDCPELQDLWTRLEQRE